MSADPAQQAQQAAIDQNNAQRTAQAGQGGGLNPSLAKWVEQKMNWYGPDVFGAVSLSEMEQKSSALKDFLGEADSKEVLRREIFKNELKNEFDLDDVPNQNALHDFIIQDNNNFFADMPKRQRVGKLREFFHTQNQNHNIDVSPERLEKISQSFDTADTDYYQKFTKDLNQIDLSAMNLSPV